MNKLNISVDDERALPQGFNMKFTSAEDFLNWYVQHTHSYIETLTLDHDLGEGQMTGYALVKVLVDIGIKHINNIQFHTNNVVGFENMYGYLMNAQKHHIISSHIHINSQHYQQVNDKLLPI